MAAIWTIVVCFVDLGHRINPVQLPFRDGDQTGSVNADEANEIVAWLERLSQDNPDEGGMERTDE